MKKNLIILTAVALCFGIQTLADDTATIEATSQATTTTAQVKDVKKTSQKTIMQASSDFSVGTVVGKGDLNSGERYNYTVWRPEFKAIFASGFLTSASLPMGWVSDQNREQRRVIGRPQLGAHQFLAYNDSLQWIAGIDVKLPIASTSYGDSELLRAWRLSPGTKFDARLGHSRFRLIGGTRLFYDSQTESVRKLGPATVTSVIDQALVVGAGLGVMHRWENGGLGLGVRTINGLGLGHATVRQTVPKMGTKEAKIDVDTIDYMSLDLVGDVDLTSQLKLQGTITKSLKSNHFETRDAIVASAESLPELATLGVGVSLTQSF